MPDQPERPKTPKEERAERSAAALRANLRRRKDQQSRRTTDTPCDTLPEAPSDEAGEGK